MISLPLAVLQETNLFSSLCFLIQQSPHTELCLGLGLGVKLSIQLSSLDRQSPVLQQAGRLRKLRVTLSC